MLAQSHVEQWLPRPLLEALGRRRLAAMLRFCYRNNDYYRDKWRDVIKRERDLDDRDVLLALPRLTKQELKDADPDAIISRGFRRDELLHTQTSGTSGIALQLHFDAAAIDHVAARQYRGMTMAGCRPWHRVAYSRKVPAPMSLSGESKGDGSVLGLFALQRIPYELTPQARVDALRACGADFYSCYPSYALSTVRAIEASALRSLGLRGIVLNSEYSSPEQRACIAEAFGCPVHDIYGAEEFWSLAALCSHQRYHLSSDAMRFEVVGSDGFPLPMGQVGDVLLTSFHNRAMPLIRYELGDRASLSSEPCPCGRNTAILASLGGRSQDYFVTPGGEEISAMDIHCALDHTPEGAAFIRDAAAFQIVQEVPERVRLDFIPSPALGESTIRGLEANLQRLMGTSVRVEANPTDRLYTQQNGKIPAMRCLASSQQGRNGADAPPCG